MPTKDAQRDQHTYMTTLDFTLSEETLARQALYAFHFSVLLAILLADILLSSSFLLEAISVKSSLEMVIDIPFQWNKGKEKSV